MMESALNALLCGAVSITSACGVVEPWSCLFIGVGATVFYLVGTWIEKFFSIDDPVGAAPIHAFGGFWGLVAIGIFADPDYLQEKYFREDLHKSVIHGGGYLLLFQLSGSGLIILWAVLCSIPAFGLMQLPSKWWRRPLNENPDFSLMNFEGKLEHTLFPINFDEDRDDIVEDNPFLRRASVINS